MIFYGTKGSHLHSERVSGIKCSNCNEITAHNISVYGKYAYIYWIPIFPMSKKTFSECSNCKVTLDSKGMDERLRNSSNNVKSNARTPIWYWSGLAIFMVLISFGIFTSLQHDKDVVNYINEPAVGDIIKFKSSEDGFYSTLKIDKVTNDSIFVIQNNYETDKKSGISDLDKAENYSTPAYSLGKNEIQQLFDDKIFYDIDR